MKLGILGLPNVGKSTLFNAITNAGAGAANYPFCTIEPNVGVVPVPDARLDKLAEIWQTNKKTPAIVEFVDIAGLVKGASKGEGLGNKFLGTIRDCDALRPPGWPPWPSTWARAKTPARLPLTKRMTSRRPWCARWAC